MKMTTKELKGAFVPAAVITMLLAAGPVLAGDPGRQKSATSSPCGHEGDSSRHGQHMQGMQRMSSGDGSSRSTRSPKASRTDRQLQGEVIARKQVTHRGSGQKHLVVMLSTNEGQRAVVDLGPSRNMSLQNGERITVSGLSARVGKRPVLFANRISRDGGRMMRIERQQQSRGNGARLASGFQVDGEILRFKTVPIRNKDVQHVVALVKTDQGRVIADLGPSNRFRRSDFDTGKKIRLIGDVRIIGDRLVLVADEARTGQRTLQIQNTFDQAPY